VLGVVSSVESEGSCCILRISSDLSRKGRLISIILVIKELGGVFGDAHMTFFARRIGAQW
jgi:hypothetical protein